MLTMAMPCRSSRSIPDATAISAPERLYICQLLIEPEGKRLFSASAAGRAVSEPKYGVGDLVGSIQSPHAERLPSPLLADRDYLDMLRCRVLGGKHAEFAAKPRDVRLEPRQELASGAG